MNRLRLARRVSSLVTLLPPHPDVQRSSVAGMLSAVVTAFTSLLVPAGFLVTAQPAHAFGVASIQFQSQISLVSPPSSGSPDGPFGMALDKAGDLFVADYNNSRVVEIPAGCASTSCQINLPTVGLSGPTGITVDGSNNVFIADYNNNRVVELPWTGGGYGAQVTLPNTGQNEPGSVAVDTAGNVFIANFDHSGSTASQVVELPWTGSGYGAPVTVVNWLSGPFGLAFDASDNLFIADEGAGQIVELPKGCSSSACQVIAASGLSLSPGPTAVSIDMSGNLFVADGQVLEVPNGCSNSSCYINIGNSLNVGLGALGVVVDGAGNIFVGDYGTNQVLDIRQNSFDTGSIGLGSFENFTAYINFNSTVTLNSTTPYALLAQGMSGMDFVDAGGGTCTATTYNSGQSCSIQVEFKPQFAGSVKGALSLFDSGGNIIATGYLSGMGSGPQLTFLPGTQSSIGGNLASSSGVALDRQGNIFVADGLNRTVEELLAPSYATTRSLGGSFSFVNPVGVGVDGAGNIFVADTGQSQIEEILGPDYSTVQGLGSGLSAPSGVAVDGSGNIYVADKGNNAVKEIIEESSYTSVKTIGSGFSAPQGVAVDSAGNVYVADTGNNAIKEIFAVDGSIPATATISTLGGSFSAPAAVAVDNLGNLYVADTGNNAVDQLSANSGFVAVNKLSTSYPSPSGVAVDSVGNVYVGSSASTQVAKLDYADPPGLTFNASVGSSSNPQTITLTNYGNQGLTFASPSSGYNPVVSSDFSIAANESQGPPCPILSSSLGAATLAPGASCVYQLTFNPSVSGAVTGSMVITDDNLDTAGSTQTISLSGTAVLVSLAPGSLPGAQIGTTYNQPLSANGGTAPYSFQVTAGVLPAGIIVSNSGLLSGTASAAGSFNFTVTATDVNGLTGSQAYALTVAAPIITLAPSSLPDAQTKQAYSAMMSAGGGTAPYSYNVTSGSLPPGLSLSSAGQLAGTPTGSGTFTFVITVTDSSTGAGAPFSRAGSYTLTVNTSTLAIAPGSLPSGKVGVTYTLLSLTASGGAAPYSYSLKSGSLPAGLSLSATGVLSGTPTSGGSFPFTVIATDAAGLTGSAAYTILVSAPTITISPGTLNNAQLGVAYAQTLTASGGTAPYSFSLAGALPTGMTFDALTGQVSGTPAVGGSFPITVTATDSSTGTGPYASSFTFDLIVNPGTATLTFAATPPQTYGNPPFTVSASSASTGTITYSVASGPATINSATGVVSALGAGEVTIQASQAATVSYNAIVAQMPINIARQDSAISIAASSSLITQGQGITLTASVTHQVTGTPTGTVSFFDGGTQIATPVTLASGSAQLVVSNLPSGQNSISAVYSGDTNFLGSTATLSSPVTVLQSDFSFTTSGNASQSIMPGDKATFSFALAPTNGNYPGTVTFSVGGLPAGASSSISPTSISSTAGPQTVTFTIQASTGSALGSAPKDPGNHDSPLALVLLLPFLGFSGLRLRRRNLHRGLRLLIMLVVGCMASWSLSGCSSASGILGHSYSIAVTATSGAAQHTAFVNLDVK